MLLLVNSHNKDIAEIPTKVTPELVKEHTSVFAVADYDDYMQTVQTFPNYNPETWKGVPPYYQVLSKPEGLWDIISIFGDEKRIIKFDQLVDMTTDSVVDFFSGIDIKEVITF